MLGIFLAFFTKTIQGMIFIPALFMYSLYKRQYFILKSPLIYLYTILILAVCVAYYILRNQIDSGYLDAAIANDLLGRFGKVIEDHSGGPFYYLKYIWMILAIGIIGLQFKQRDHSDISEFSVFLSVVFLFYLLVISAASTKLYWYIIPLAPLASMLMAIAIYQLVEDKLFKATLLGINTKLIVFLAIIFAGFLIFAYNARYIEQKENDSKILVANQYNYFLRSEFVQSRKIQKFAVVHPGYENNNFDFYIAPALFYINILRKSMDVAVLQTDATLPKDYQYLLFCGKEIKNRMESQVSLQAIEIEGQCGMYAILSRKTQP
jgi:4-amino-4-deoxy-L-arabinose transferase-like glycosyltransferase